jgi:hypothetical protein
MVLDLNKNYKMKPLIITALYDIGRSEWKDYNMSYNTYLHWMGNTLNLKCEMVIFTEVKFEERIREMRSKVDPNGEMTKYVINTLEDLGAYQKWNEHVAELMESEDFKAKRHFESVPEMNYPLYNIVMFNKVYFLKQASLLCPEATHLIWLDAGGIREEIDYSENWPDLNKLESNKIMKFSHSSDFTINDPEWHSLSQVRHIQGTAFVCPSYMIDWYMNEINKTIQDCISKRFIGSDEKIFDLTYLKDPKNFSLIKTDWREYYNWLK